MARTFVHAFNQFIYPGNNVSSGNWYKIFHLTENGVVVYNPQGQPISDARQIKTCEEYKQNLINEAAVFDDFVSNQGWSTADARRVADRTAALVRQACMPSSSSNGIPGLPSKPKDGFPGKPINLERETVGVLERLLKWLFEPNPMVSSTNVSGMQINNLIVYGSGAAVAYLLIKNLREY